MEPPFAFTTDQLTMFGCISKIPDLLISPAPFESSLQYNVTNCVTMPANLYFDNSPEIFDQVDVGCYLSGFIFKKPEL